ncbi:energy-coupling factor transporter transmembrane protein EcfT [Pseudomonas chengduensis]|jgi:hypothetical protein|uniref:Uncharacterized protein n=1 Tax=Pseudomonas sihuiensis TaxID=1274359 RepID=A0A1H2LAA3_9PSED|nr:MULTISPECIES: hypothetical protein [Pseudomonas]KQO40923.1 hypothetical protein ASF15_21630 [Pseudomonas sp. Leaf83]MDH0957256.1 energy-coupling factor transporter transmembrane protein EcfT [Pseudomonas chengduensis]MDH1622400.1 energy-coupling factor transporter transmembrane protein EcfT [Pseudomonas chengduensis]SDU77655.1 hypothetical protein SAMN05216363_0847 [Pseudomonas sihuiensis]
MSSKTDEYDCPAQDRVVFALLALIVPLLSGIFLPWWSVVWLIVSMFFAIAIIALSGYPKVAKQLPAPLFTLLIGFGFQLWGEVSGWLGFLVGLFVFLFGSIHTMLWAQFLRLDSYGAKHGVSLRFQGQAPALVVAPRSRYLPKDGTAWQDTSTDGFAWVIDGRVTQQLQVGVDQWSPRIVVRTAEDSSSSIELPTASRSTAQELQRQGEVDCNGHLIFRSPQGGHILRGEPCTEVDGQGGAGYSFWLDEKPTGLVLEQDASVLWSEDDQALVCRARVESQPVEETATWLWRAASGWRPLEEPWQSLVDEPVLEWSTPCRLEDERLFYEALMHGAETEKPMALTLCIELEGEHAGALSLQLPSMQGGAQPCLNLLRKSRDGRRHAFACHVGAWRLPGQWCLDHRVSDCGRYLALIAFAEAPAVPHQLVVADVLARRLLRLDEPLLIAGLQAFEDGVISLQQIVGRQASAVGAGPLPRLEALAPAAQQADAFVAVGRLHHRTVQVAVDAWSLRLLPNWRLEWRPVPASSLGDYLLAAPGAGDAAWLFGLDREMREGSGPVPGGACVLTASGCGVADLAPSMVWSADGRYLALSRRVISEETIKWHLLLLDTREHTLRHSAQPLPTMPCFEAFDAAGLHVSGVEHEVQLITMETLLALPRQMLIRSGDVWLPAEQLSDAVHWQRLDSAHLQSWRAPGIETSRA